MENDIELITIAIIWGLAVVTPGPNFFIVCQIASGKSRAAAVSSALGITAGTIIWGVCGYTGITLLFRTAPAAFTALKLVGGMYLIYLGIKLLRSPKTASGNVTDSGSSYIRNFIAGLVTNITNPKTAVFVASLFAVTAVSSHTIIGGIVTVLLMSLISFTWYGAVAYVFSAERFRRIYERREQAIKKTAGAIFAGFGLKLIFSK